MTTTGKTSGCVLLADRHHGLTEGIRGLPETLFRTVVMVADESSLQETAARLRPEVIVADLSLARDRSLRCLERLRQRHPETNWPSSACTTSRVPAGRRWMPGRTASCSPVPLPRTYYPLSRPGWPGLAVR